MMPGLGIDWLGIASVPLLIGGLLAFSALLIFALIHAADDLPDRAGVHLTTPRSTLDERLAKGELSRDDYIESRKALDFKTAIV